MSRESIFGIFSTILDYFLQQGFEKSIIDLKDSLFTMFDHDLCLAYVYVQIFLFCLVLRVTTTTSPLVQHCTVAFAILQCKEC